MKKTLLTIMATVCVMTIGCGIYVNTIKSDYDAKLEEVKATYEDEIKSISLDRLNYELNNIDQHYRMEELTDQLIDVMEGNGNEIVFVKDGSKYIYEVEANVTHKGVLKPNMVVK